MICKVADGLYLGDHNAPYEVKNLPFYNNLTHILRLGEYDDEGLHGHYAVMEVPLLDEDEANLLDVLARCIAFLQKGAGVPGKCALVHCHAGVSRSVAVACAFVMSTTHCSLQEALAGVRQVHPGAQPNEGFMAQLALFADMGCRIDNDHTGYRKFCAEQMSFDFQQAGYVDEERLAEVVEGAAGGSGTLRCRKCRRVLATGTSILPPQEAAGAGGGGFRYRRRPAADTGRDESSLFLEPMRWMEGIVGETQGKICCPKCGARLGHFNWAGLQNTAGAWVTPGFQIHRSRVDWEPPADAAGAFAGPVVAQPRTLPASSPGALEFIVFDCDGVLVDTERASCESLRRAILQVTGSDIPHKFPEDYYPVFGMDVRSCVEFYKAQRPENASWDVDGVASAVAAAKEGIYEELTSGGITAWDGAREVVEAALRAGVPVAVGSSGSPAKIKRNLELSGLSPLFDPTKVVSAKEVGRGKPAPDVYLECLRRLGCADASRALVVEDAVNGCMAARAAGCFVAAVTNSLPRDRLAAHADVVVGNIRELLSLPWAKAGGGPLPS
ncbi:unnamed protein product [Pedinophyceae sp. YPF-701]|nr:unnamed protein product [Pedinophyceae sp. YPF-701]